MPASDIAKVIKDPVMAATRKRPDIFWIVIVVMLFLGFEIYQLNYSSKLSELRIEQCHSVQSASTSALMKLADSLIEQSTEFALLIESNKNLQDTVKELTDEMRNFRNIIRASGMVSKPKKVVNFET